MGSVSTAFQESFADATVVGIEHEGIEEVGPPAGSIYVAAVTFSNGVVVVFGGGRPEAVPRPSRAQELDRGAYGRSKGRIRIATSCKPQRGNRDCSVSSAAATESRAGGGVKRDAVYGVSGAVGGSVETAWPPPSPRKTNCPRRRSVPWRVPRLEKFAKFVGGLSFSSVSRGCPRPPGSELVADLSTETWGIATRLSASGRNRQCSAGSSSARR